LTASSRIGNRSRFCQERKRKPVVQPAQQTRFRALHQAADRRGRVIKSAQMQHSMDKAPNQLEWPARPKSARMRDDIVEADKKFAVEARTGCALRVFRVIECDYIGGTLMTEELLIDAAHFARCDQMNPKLEFREIKASGQQRAGDAPEQAGVDATDALTVVQQQFGHFAAPRCSS
jgi:hypothetical protein